MIIHPKFAAVLTLVPNQRVYDLHLGRAFQDAGDVPVLVSPALEVLSRWVEQISTRISLLQGRRLSGSADRLWLDQAWQQAVRAQPEWTSAFESSTLAQSARAAERLLRQWTPADTASTANPVFHRWRSTVRAALQDRQLFTPEDWLCHLHRQLEQPGELPLGLPSAIRLHGFIELTRLEQSLLEALRCRGIQIIDMCGTVDGAGAPSEAAKRVLHSFDSASEEFRAAADWAMKRLGQGSRRIAIVVNGLEALAGQLAPVFDRIIHPHDGTRIALTGDSLYHLADGSRLSEHGVVEDALLVLRLSSKGQSARHPFPDISRLLLSPYLAGWRDERTARARFEALLRREGRYFWSLRDLQELLDHWQLKSQLPALSVLLTHTSPFSNNADTAQALLSRLLEWGWPGPLAHNSLAAGRVRQFIRLLEHLRHSTPGSPQEALASLCRWCRDTRVTERGGPLSPIQLMSPEDAVGQSFDAAWVMNIHDGNWPGHPVTNPFLPHATVRLIPRATPEGELRFTRKVQNSMDRLASEVHYSWSHSADEVPRLASPLLASAANIDGGQLPVPQWPVLSPAPSVAAEFPYGHPWLQAVEDNQGLPLYCGALTRIPGGSAMVKDQSACPLMAYLIHRLQLRFEPMPGPFADYAYRGKLLHEALHQLFREQVGRPGLPAGTGIAAAVEHALHSRQARLRLSPPALRAEQQRLQHLLQQWLAFESQRKGFVVAALEQKRSIEVHGLALDIRLDRVDQLADGRQLIIDYKSGAVDARAWMQKRIAEPQLPLYAVLLDREHPASVGGLALASVRTGDCRMAGIVDDPAAAWQTLYSTDNRRTVFGRQFARWEDLFGHWKAGIGDLLQEIAGGHAANRLYQPEGLRYAGLDTVLRRAEGEAWLLANGAAGITREVDWEDD